MLPSTICRGRVERNSRTAFPGDANGLAAPRGVGPTQPRRFVEHPTQRDWPAEALAGFRASADREGIFELYSHAVARFEWQLLHLERSELCFLLKCKEYPRRSL